MKINTDKTRAISEMPFGVACYEGAEKNGHFIGTHKGVCRDWDDAMIWLSGREPETLVVVYANV